MSAQNAEDRAERTANHFVSYLFDKYHGTRHVRRVATWIGFLLRAIYRLAGPTVKANRERQIIFEYRGHKFKARYSHQAGSRGGIDFLEVLAGRGMPDGKRVLQITNLAEAEDVYNHLQQKLDHFVTQFSSVERER